MIGLQYKLFGVDEHRRSLQRAARAGHNPRQLLERIGQILLGNNRRNFARNQWPALRTRSGSPLRTSRDQLYQAATVRGAKGNVFEVGRYTVKVGVRLPYARLQAQGGTIKAKRWRTKTGKGPYLVFKTDRGWVMKKQVTIPARNYAALNRSTPSLISRTTGWWMREQITGVTR